MKRIVSFILSLVLLFSIASFESFSMYKMYGKPNEETEKRCQDGYFLDVDYNAWYIRYVKTGISDYFAHGRNERYFAPNAYATREEVVVFLMNYYVRTCFYNKGWVLESFDESGIYVEDFPHPFKDIKKGSWCEAQIALAYNLGLISGVSKDEFGIGQYMKRQDLFIIISRWVNTLGYQHSVSNYKYYGINRFFDYSDISDYAYNDVVLACSLENEDLPIHLVDGVREGNKQMLYPQRNITRAELMCLIYVFNNVLTCYHELTS